MYNSRLCTHQFFLHNYLTSIDTKLKKEYLKGEGGKIGFTLVCKRNLYKIGKMVIKYYIHYDALFTMML